MVTLKLLATCSTSASGETTWNARWSHPIPHDDAYYAKCVFGGIVACGVTHTAITPLDVVKCNMQVDPVKYPGLMPGIRTVIAEEGVIGLAKGWGPTALGYSLQGAGKFGLYEVFKDMYSTALGEEKSYHWRGMIYSAASGSAEFFADILLCPWEMTKVKIQTSPPGTFPVGFGPALKEMRTNSEYRFPFGSLVPLWGRQIPYTIAKFYFFEKVVEGFYTYVFTKEKDSYNKPTQLGITFASGYLAGIICAIVSHPADSLVSLMGKAEHKSKSLSQIAGEVGAFNLITKGLAPRIVMIGTLTGLQWWIYDTFKTAMGMGTTGGAAKK